MIMNRLDGRPGAPSSSNKNIVTWKQTSASTTKVITEKKVFKRPGKRRDKNKIFFSFVRSFVRLCRVFVSELTDKNFDFIFYSNNEIAFFLHLSLFLSHSISFTHTHTLRFEFVLALVVQFRWANHDGNYVKITCKLFDILCACWLWWRWCSSLLCIAQQNQQRKQLKQQHHQHPKH